jgi:RecJ-like exonuclease
VVFVAEDETIKLPFLIPDGLRKTYVDRHATPLISIRVTRELKDAIDAACSAIQCPECEGSGEMPGGEHRKCAHCGGSKHLSRNAWIVRAIKKALIDAAFEGK